MGQDFHKTGSSGFVEKFRTTFKSNYREIWIRDMFAESHSNVERKQEISFGKNDDSQRGKKGVLILLLLIRNLPTYLFAEQATYYEVDLLSARAPEFCVPTLRLFILRMVSAKDKFILIRRKSLRANPSRQNVYSPLGRKKK
ncbi:unnamed protein product [Hermetia illucens]|uniref:Uncharacterized protein n=1 Tax=Hermetia illucens TaxID=343691 RepID=A0A7R8UAL9_HERIL|nr:unnamed protein product [Hermetia illucens]